MRFGNRVIEFHRALQVVPRFRQCLEGSQHAQSD
jgi:hypothetical protein